MTKLEEAFEHTIQVRNSQRKDNTTVIPTEVEVLTEIESKKTQTKETHIQYVNRRLKEKTKGKDLKEGKISIPL